MKFPAHKCGLFLTHNEHRNYYESVAEWLEKPLNKPEWKNDDARLRAIDMDEVWILQWYPKTPIGFNFVAAPTLEELLEFAAETEAA